MQHVSNHHHNHPFFFPLSSSSSSSSSSSWGKKAEEMLQRAASSAYSWWWASHIRTKQSKWLRSNLLEMEDKVEFTLQLLEEDADTFAKRAEMYYQRRPELINFIQESYESYRALAERYEHVSRELQKANNAISVAFPDQFQFGMEDEEAAIKPSAVKINFFEKLPHQLATGVSSKRKTGPETGTADKAAQEEISKLQREILVLQTEKEFVKSTYEVGMQKYSNIDKHIAELQDKVRNWQVEVSVDAAAAVIEDDEARALMAVAALKSCEDTLVNLHEQQKTSMEGEYGRIMNAKQKLRILRGACGEPQKDEGDDEDEKESDMSRNILGEQIHGLENRTKLDLQCVCEKVRKNFETNSGMSVLDVADKIDELVSSVVSLESTVSSQIMQIQRLRMENDELQKNLQSLEEEKIDTDGLSEKLRQEEEKLLKIQHLHKCLQEERSKQHIHFTEACSSFSDLADKLQFSEQKQDKADDEQDLVTKQQVEESEENEIKQEESSSEEDEDFHSPGEISLPLWQQLFLDGLDDSEKILLSEYTNVVRHFKDKMRKLAEEEMKNQDNLFRTCGQISHQVGNTMVKGDDEIRLLQQKLNSLENGKNQHDEEEDDDDDAHSFAYHSCAISPQNEEASLKMSDEREAGDGLHTKEKFRRDIDELLAENLEFWLRFSSSIRQIQIYRTKSQDIRAEIPKVRKKDKQEEGDGISSSIKSEIKEICKELKDVDTKLSVWMEQNASLKEELQSRFLSLCNIKVELLNYSNQSTDGREEGEEHFSAYQASKFQGEVLNMLLENNKVGDELQVGLNQVREIQGEVRKTLAMLSKHFELSKGHRSKNNNSSGSTSGVPLSSFLFGPKPRRPSLFSCIDPAFQRQYSGNY